MNEKIEHILNLIQQADKLSEEEREAITKSLKDADKEISISAFKIERLEKVKYTTTVLLEQTIEELETKRKSVEAQKRELEIEAALERVRARTMAMQRSDELQETSLELFQQLKELGEPVEQLSVGIMNEAENIVEISATLDGKKFQETFRHSGDEPFVMNKIISAWKAQQKSLIIEQSTGELEAYNKYRNELTGSVKFPIRLQPGEKRFLYIAFFSKGMLGLSTSHPRPKESLELLERFASVFDLTYTRFSDLKQAEAQTRESQIQLALERVRARTMAMQHSDELSETAHILFQQFKHLGEDPIQITIGIFNEEQNVIEFRITGGDGSGSRIDQTFHADIDEPTLINKFFRAWKENKKSTIISLEGKELSQWIAYRNKISGEYAHETEVKSTDRRYAAAGFFSKGLLSVSTIKPPAAETIQILERFASVFDLTYTRFIDLKKAEAQAREAQIEAALERVRSRTMAMHQTSELQEVIHAVHKELLNLKLSIDGGSFVVINSDVGSELCCWGSGGTANTSEEVEVPHFDMPFVKNLIQGIKNGQEFFTEEFSQQEKEEFFTKLFQHKPWSDLSNEQKNETLSGKGEYTRSVAVSKHTSIFIINHHGKKFTDEENDILKRFAKVFEQTYTRFLDLQKAEAQAREAQIEAALEKVRSRTMAMQKSDELAETAAVMFSQLIQLGLAPNRLYIILIDEENALMESWVTDEDGTKLSMAFKGDYKRNTSLQKMYQGWKENKKTLIIDMQGEELQNYLHYLHHELNVPFKGGMEQQRRVQYIAYFNKGLIGMASPEPQADDTLQLIERFAAVFNLTFTRFNDLQIAEAHAMQAEKDLIAIKEAKQKAEDALTELQATQKQLVQSEKMASLGELTAGIAHEIQNPLNFVNNFAEINTELVDELKEELSKGSLDQANLIADDLKDNNQKIAFHGKRADSIVKGMLQHSRSSTGKKEPTDINSLADEFLRLSYHGLRAKDKSFNATMETNFDYNIDKVQIIPQDLGRVLLNLFNNAFYSVSEKKKRLNGLYEPKVFVSTQKLNDKIEIVVKDNGNGIPQKIIDKIYQPFFTTKPTGEGTGLGLSLSYDIITKGHNGELKVETKEGEFAQFKIILPTTV